MARVLVVEDEFIIAAHIATLIEEAGCEVVGPTGALNEARELASREDLDAATLDISLEGAAIDDIAGILSQRGIPFLFVSGYGREHLPAAFRDRPLVGKPFDEATFVRAVLDMVAGRTGDVAN